jgi:hypothetical protein
MNQDNGNYDSRSDDLHNILEALKIQALSLERLKNKVSRIEKTLSNDLAEIRQRVDSMETELAKR